MISTRISPIVMIRAIQRLLSGATLGLHAVRDRAQNSAVPSCRVIGKADGHAACKTSAQPTVVRRPQATCCIVGHSNSQARAGQATVTLDLSLRGPIYRNHVFRELDRPPIREADAVR